MAYGEILVSCTQCGNRSRMPISALQRDNYHCSRCGVHIQLAGVKADPGNPDERPHRARSKRPFHRRKRR